MDVNSNRKATWWSGRVSTKSSSLNVYPWLRPIKARRMAVVNKTGLWKRFISKVKLSPNSNTTWNVFSLSCSLEDPLIRAWKRHRDPLVFTWAEQDNEDMKWTNDWGQIETRYCQYHVCVMNDCFFFSSTHQQSTGDHHPLFKIQD